MIQKHILGGHKLKTDEIPMTKDLTQKRMINTFGMLFVENIKGDRYWRLKYLVLRAFRNPGDEIAHTAKHRRISPILVSTGREHEHETLNSLAVFSPQSYSHIQWVRDVVCLSQGGRITIISYLVRYGILNNKK